jgi:anti-sigma regulatory factor (Ser/Thr protein kinase)
MTLSGRDSTVGAAVSPTVPRLALDVRRVPDQVAPTRHALVAFLVEHGVPSTIVDDLELIASELVTNAIVHPDDGGGHPVRVEVETSDTIVVAVSNVGSAAAIPPVDEWVPAPPLAVSGRGLGIVRRLSDAVSVEQRGELTVVTCHRRLPDGGGAP